MNTYKQPEKRKSSNFFGWINRLFKLDDSLQNNIHLRFLPQISFIVFLSVIYISSRHSAERKIREINELETAVEDLRADYQTLKSSYMFASKQSEVSKKASDLGLFRYTDSPKLITRE